MSMGKFSIYLQCKTYIENSDANGYMPLHVHYKTDVNIYL